MTDTPRRIQLRRTKGWRKPEGAVVVSRPTRWGNPFRLGTPLALARVPGALSDAPWEYEGRISADGTRHDYFHPDGRRTVHHVRYMTAAESVETYRRAITGDLTPAMRSAAPAGRFVRDQPTVAEIRGALAGRDLACWCPLGEPCHADVLLEIANAAVLP